MKKSILSLLIGSTLFTACSKVDLITPTEPVVPCQMQTEDPAGRSYVASSVVDYVCTDKHCGILPLSTQNYWVYEDSIFSNGNFSRVQFDTLRFTSMKISTTDGLVWWKGNISVGLPSVLYSNESAFYTLSNRMFTPDVMDARADYIVPEGDSVKYLASFEDAAASGRSVRLTEPVQTAIGSFTGCIYFEKNARYFRRDQVIYKPGLGVLKYTKEIASPGDRNIKLQQVSTLVNLHIE